MTEEKTKGLVDLVQKTATEAMKGIGRAEEAFEHAQDAALRGLGGANAALATPEGANLATLLPATDLPELAADGPLGAMATRLDREADLLRGVALRELSRVSWVVRIGQTVLVASVICEIAIASCATILAIFGSLERGGLLALAATIVAVGAAGVMTFTSRTRTAHVALANDAMERARRIEDRLFRVGIALEWRRAGDALYQEALARLERDLTGA